MNEVQRKIKEQLDCQHQEHLRQVDPFPTPPPLLPHTRPQIPTAGSYTTSTA